MGERDQNQILMHMRRAFHSFDGDSRMQPPLPRVELREPLGGRRRAFVSNVVGDAGEGVDGGDVRAHRRRQQARRDRKILVVRAGHGLARGVGARQRLGPVGHCRF